MNLWSRGRLANLLLLLCSSSVAIVSAEMTLRLAWQNPYASELHPTVLPLPLHPPLMDLRIRRRRLGLEPTRFRTDARSYVLPSARFARPDATIAFLGGSTTACKQNQERLRFPALVSALLEARGLRINALNAGRAGATLADSVHVLINHVVVDRPDFVVVMHAVNDIGHLRRYGSYTLVRHISVRTAGQALLRRLSAELSLAGLARWVTFADVPGPDDSRVRFAFDSQRHPLPTEAFAKRLRLLGAAAQAFGIEPVVMTQPLGWEWSETTPG